MMDNTINLQLNYYQKYKNIFISIEKKDGGNKMAEPYNVTIKRHNGDAMGYIYPKDYSRKHHIRNTDDARIPGLAAK